MVQRSHTLRRTPVNRPTKPTTIGGLDLNVQLDHRLRSTVNHLTNRSIQVFDRKQRLEPVHQAVNFNGLGSESL